MGHAPEDAAVRRAVEPVIVYPNDSLPPPDLALYRAARAEARKTDEVLVKPRDWSCFRVPAGGFFRISSVEGPQVGDLNLWHAGNLEERRRQVGVAYDLVDGRVGAHARAAHEEGDVNVKLVDVHLGRRQPEVPKVEAIV